MCLRASARTDREAASAYASFTMYFTMYMDAPFAVSAAPRSSGAVLHPTHPERTGQYSTRLALRQLMPCHV